MYDAQADEGFELEVDGSRALDAYHHPFAYVTDEETARKVAAAGSQAA